MPRDMTSIKQIHTAAELIKFMQEDPQDRVFLFTSNLAPNEFNEHGVAIRTNDTVLSVCSLRAARARTLPEFCDEVMPRSFVTHTHSDEIAVIANSAHDHLGLLVIPDDIQTLLREAEEQTPGRVLSWSRYEDIFVLTTHAEAE